MSRTVGVADPQALLPATAPEAGQLAQVRGRMWVVGDVVRDAQASLDDRPVQHLVSQVSVEDDATGEELEVVWEIEPGTTVVQRAELPAIDAGVAAALEAHVRGLMTAGFASSLTAQDIRGLLD